MTPFRTAVLISVLASCWLMMSGCESKVTVENYDKVKVGMTMSEVEGLLGSGKDQTSSGGYTASDTGLSSSKGPKDQTFVWEGESGGKIVLTFADGKVVAKAKQGMD